MFSAHNSDLEWKVLLRETFKEELFELSAEFQDGIAIGSRMLREFGPQLGRPHVDTLEGSQHSNMKELRFDADNGVWRVAFAFDPKRRAVLLPTLDDRAPDDILYDKNGLPKA